MFFNCRGSSFQTFHIFFSMGRTRVSFGFLTQVMGESCTKGSIPTASFPLRSYVYIELNYGAMRNWGEMSLVPIPR